MCEKSSGKRLIQPWAKNFGAEILNFERPTLADVMEAKKRIAPYVWRTPLHHYLGLDNELEAEVWVKHENHQRLGAFKVRGGVNLLSQLSDDDKAHGVITASSGNHGQSVAFRRGSSA